MSTEIRNTQSKQSWRNVVWEFEEKHENFCQVPLYVCESTTKMIIILCTNQGTNKNIFVFFQRYLNILFIYVLVRYTLYICTTLRIVKCGLVLNLIKKILESLSFTQLCTWKYFIVNVFKSFLSCHKILSYHSIFTLKKRFSCM